MNKTLFVSKVPLFFHKGFSLMTWIHIELIWGLIRGSGADWGVQGLLSKGRAWSSLLFIYALAAVLSFTANCSDVILWLDRW